MRRVVAVCDEKDAFSGRCCSVRVGCCVSQVFCFVECSRVYVRGVGGVDGIVAIEHSSYLLFRRFSK